jgi:hypothetical protein
MRRHELKLWTSAFDEMASGRKRADVRRCDDRDFRRGDEILYRHYLPTGDCYSGRALLARVTHLVRWAGDLELCGILSNGGGPATQEILRAGSRMTVQLVRIVVLSIEVLEVGPYEGLKQTAVLSSAGDLQTPGEGGRP